MGCFFSQDDQKEELISSALKPDSKEVTGEVKRKSDNKSTTKEPEHVNEAVPQGDSFVYNQLVTETNTQSKIINEKEKVETHDNKNVNYENEISPVDDNERLIREEGGKLKKEEEKMEIAESVADQELSMRKEEEDWALKKEQEWVNTKSQEVTGYETSENVVIVDKIEEITGEITVTKNEAPVILEATSEIVDNIEPEINAVDVETNSVEIDSLKIEEVLPEKSISEVTQVLEETLAAKSTDGEEKVNVDSETIATVNDNTAPTSELSSKPTEISVTSNHLSSTDIVEVEPEELKSDLLTDQNLTETSSKIKSEELLPSKEDSNTNTPSGPITGGVEQKPIETKPEEEIVAKENLDVASVDEGDKIIAEENVAESLEEQATESNATTTTNSKRKKNKKSISKKFKNMFKS